MASLKELKAQQEALKAQIAAARTAEAKMPRIIAYFLANPGSHPASCVAFLGSQQGGKVEVSEAVARNTKAQLDNVLTALRTAKTVKFDGKVYNFTEGAEVRHAGPSGPSA